MGSLLRAPSQLEGFSPSEKMADGLEGKIIRRECYVRMNDVRVPLKACTTYVF